MQFDCTEFTPSLLPGKDATESFEDVGHSEDARELVKTMLVGTFDGGDVCIPSLFFFSLSFVRGVDAANGAKV